METPEDVPRVKFLCSFGGSILPRPIDGKLRYVGGETRIVNVARDIGFKELMMRMKEFFESASLLKYQQPDEDLDSLVSVVNDDDVINMMEEYDKLGQSDGFTRLRIFLFSHTDDDSCLFDVDERESQRRYMDALNSLNDPSDFSRQSEMGGQSESFQLAGQFFNSVQLDNMRGYEVMAPQYNGHQLDVLHSPLVGHYSGPVVFQDHEMGFPGLPHIAAPLGTMGGREVPSQTHLPRYNEMEMPWSPVYHSSAAHQPSHESRLVSDFCSSPSTTHRHVGFDLHDRTFDECSSNGHNIAGACAAMSHQGCQATYDPPSALVDNSPVVQHGNPIAGDSSRFQLNVNNHKTPPQGNSKCEHCHLAFMRNQALLESDYADARWRHAPPYLDHANEGHCKECYLRKEAALLNPDVKENGVFSRDQFESEHTLGDFYDHERGWIAHRMSHWPEEARSHISGVRRLNERYVNLPHNSPDSHPLPVNYINQEDPHHVHSECLHENVRCAPHSHIHAPLLDDFGIKYGNFLDPIGKNDHFVPLGPAYSLQKTGQAVIHGTPPSESLGLPAHTDGATSAGIVKATQVGSPGLRGNDENARVVQCENPYPINPFDASSADHALSMNRNIVNDHNQGILRLLGDKELNAGAASFPREAGVDAGSVFATGQEPASLIHKGRSSNPLHPMRQSPKDLLGFTEITEPRRIAISSSLPKSDAIGSSGSSNCNTLLQRGLDITTEQTLLKQEVISQDLYVLNQVLPQTDTHGCNSNSPGCDREEAISKSVVKTCDVIISESNDVLRTSNKVELSECLKFIPELMASVKKAKLEGIQQIQVQENGDAHDVHGQENNRAGVPPNIAGSNRSSVHELEPDEDHNDDNPSALKIEQTKAEEEALEKGLQTIKNSDLEEIRQLGSGTYGAVYHGKWKGSDVAIKKIKPSCFAGRPSERERLIADFWKEALILSTLHHPNVVSFYGVVRDGPGGSLATVTEFMVNGSLKQVLQKKDRTIDRRKRLIIAMDASFGMEYLHEKKIVHFDLKCENLLVNMKDPHRPVCKIGDLGLSKVRQQTLVSGGVRGTLPWMAPELLSGKNNMVTEKIDVYSFGIVMWELLTGEEPYADMHCAAIIGGIVNNSLRPQIPTWCDPEWRSLMENCWSSDPGERPSFAEISQTLRKMFGVLSGK